MIEISGLYKHYGRDALYQDFSIDFEKGKVTALVGPSGCGKTTLLKILAGLEPYEKGQIIGLEKGHLSMVFQEDRLIPWLDVYENIAFVLKKLIKDSQALENCVRASLKKLKLEEEINTSIQQLSGGMQRRVSLARALAYEYDLLLMDEPFKGIDRLLKLEIMKALKDQWQIDQKTVIMITHDLEEAQLLADCIYELNGKPVNYCIKR